MTWRDEAVTLKVENVKKGLYYGIKAATTLEGLDGAVPTWNREAAKEDGVLSLTAPTLGKRAFYRIVVNDQTP